MRFRLLGPMRVQVSGSPVRITAPKQRTVLAMLLVRAGRVVPARSLMAEVWDDRPPRSAAANLRTYLMQLRRLLPEDRLVTSDVGYLLRAEPEELDLLEFEALAARGHRELAGRDLSAAEESFTRALELWDGPAAEDVPLGPTLREVAARLTDHYLGVVEEHADIQLALGRNAAAAARLREAIGRHPLRERLHGQLMVALYRGGDAAGALDAFGAARRVLADELGIDPGPELRRLHQAILRRDTDLPVADRATAAVTAGGGHPRPRLLPRAPTVFVGRSAELARLRAVLHGAANPPVVTLHGPGGAGKSALALKAAHGAADLYPDGQLYADLQGSTPGLAALRPAEVLGRFLRALGVPPGDVPAVPAEAATRYQSLLADRRVLVVLDNAVGAAQVAPLLPAGGGCAVLITSRAPLTTVDALPVAVGMFGEAESVRLLESLAGPERVAAEAEAAVEIARWCGHHPLALRVAGARLAARPDWSLTRFGERLGDRQRRLDELQTADLRVRTCFEVGYGTLTSTAKAAFRLFGVLEVPEVGVETAAALTDADETAAEAALDELTEARLLEPVGDGRFRMHDLLRLFAAELAAVHDTPEERARAVGRVLDRYLGRCRRLQGLLQPHLVPSGGEAREPGADPQGLAAAVRWLETELPCLVAAAAQAEKSGRDGFAVELMDLTRAVMMKNGYWRELEALARLAIEAARRGGDRVAEASTLATLGLVEWRSGRSGAAHGALSRALELWRDVGEPAQEGMALHNLGWLCMQTGDLDAALDHIGAGLLVLETHGSNRVGLVAHNLGEVLLRLGRYAEAVDRFERCLSIRRADRDLYGESITLAGLGRALCLLDRRESALEVLAEALSRCEEIGNREDQWEVLLSRSEIHLRRGDPAAAAADLDRALEPAARTGDAYGRAACLRQLSRARAALGDPRAEGDAAEAARLLSDPATRRDPVLERLLTARL
ncbi:SARP family transcriptional regulator [Planomonospora parontospora subsp. parontospora]|uniref:SARP family transcriptional regulator n=2 Tax=Planomonospora parontospora TaxID=58119 RepID=A0AA37BNP8_9ACTN|nr:BTAD domain-containing putative transcriptional regulator [Planomonospora parontospora]GGK99309.1 SARP family transcriptional regulator [Planomonospora parontospora]GII12969.1 SARP family transcriptional regulator [Planomonospora parontospora subsp. parontospora]